MTEHVSASRRPQIHRDPLALLVFALTLALDQLTKALVRGSLSLGESLPEEGFFRLTHVTNNGAIFGLFPNQAIVMTAASLVGIAVLLYFYHVSAGGDWRVRLSLGLLLGGAVGNLIDRLWMGEVTDFLDVGAWPVFNLADSSIVTGVCILAFVYLFPHALVGNRGGLTQPAEDAGGVAVAEEFGATASSTGGEQSRDDD